MYIGPWQEWRLAQRLAEIDNNVQGNRPLRRLRRNQRQIDFHRKDSGDSEKLPLIEQNRCEDKLLLTRYTTTTTPKGVKSRKNCNGFSRHLEGYCETVITKKSFDRPSGAAKLSSNNDDTSADNDNILESRNKRSKKKKSKPAKNKSRRRKQLGLHRVQKMKRMYSNVRTKEKLNMNAFPCTDIDQTKREVTPMPMLEQDIEVANEEVKRVRQCLSLPKISEFEDENQLFDRDLLSNRVSGTNISESDLIDWASSLDIDKLSDI